MAARPDIFLIWGAGGHGKVVADVLRALGHVIRGYVDADSAKVGRTAEPGGASVIVSESDFVAGGEHDRPLMPELVTAVALGIGDNAARLRAARRLPAELLPALAHPSAVVSPSATLGVGTVVFPKAVVNASARLGCATIVNTSAVVEHDCAIGDGAHIAPGALMLGGSSAGDLAWIGAGSVVLPGIRVGSRAVVGAGAVVTRDVADDVVVVGCPARPRL